MSQKRRLHRSRRRKEKKKKSPAFKRSRPRASSKKTQNSKLKMKNCGIPQFVVRAHAAVKTGRVEEATRLFKENAVKVATFF